jgi:hypothetical protein
MMTPTEESVNLIFAVCPCVETPVVSPDSFLEDESILDDQNLSIESHSSRTQYNDIPSPVEALENTSETSEVPGVEEPDKVEINPDKCQLEVDKLYSNLEEDDIQCFQTTSKHHESNQESTRTTIFSSLKTSRSSSFNSGGRKRVK